MINTSTEYQQAMAQKRRFIARASCLLKNGTVLNFDKTNLMAGGVKIADGVSGTSKFEVGTAIINQLTIMIFNGEEMFSDYDFTDAVITVWVGMPLTDRIEWLKKGVFNASDPTTTPSVITLKALDNMSKFDQAYDGGISFPATLQSIVQHCCTRCGVLLVNGEFPNYLYEISRDPFGGTDNITYRAIIAYCALLAGCYARCNTDGRLELKWYDTAAFSGDIDGGIFDQTAEPSYQTGDNLDGGNFTDYSSGDTADGGTFTDVLPYHHIYSFSSLSVSTEDVVITGIRVTAADSEDESGNKVEGETYLCGAEGYILDVSGNPLIESGKAREVAEYLAGRIVGMRFRPFQASAIGDPSWEAGDAAIITDRKGNSYNTYLTNITYSTGSYASISCDAEPAARHSADRYAEINKIVSDIKKDNQQKLSQYAQYVDQLNTLAINAMGYYETVEKQDDGSIIKYMHDKPLLSESQTIFKNSIDGFFWSRDGGKTYTFGVSKDGNAVMNVIAAIGIAAEWIDTRGFKATDDAGNVTFEIDANTGKVRIVCESFSLTGKSIEEISQMATEDIINAVASDLQAQVDGKIESYNQSSDPSTAWTSTAVKQAHKGDLWYWNNVTKRWNGAAWETLPVSDEAARELAQSKKRIFVSQPIPPYDVGDLWVQGSSGDIMKCKKAKTSGSFALSDWELACKYTDDSALKNFVNGDYAEALKDIGSQVDKKAETWRQTSDPATAWTTAALKEQHKGDLWYNENNQKSYIYTGAGWQEMKTNPPDSVFDAIDGKAQIFTSQPVPPYDIGDLWVQGASGDIMKCKTARASGNYAASDWERASKYTDDKALQTFLSGDYADTLKEIRGQIDGKAETWRQASDPSAAWTTTAQKQQHKGDIWCSTSSSKYYIYTGSAWEEMKTTPPDSVFDMIDGKSQIFTSQPVPPYDVGDLWVQGGTGDIMRCKTARASGNYTASDWEKASKYTDDSAVKDLDEKLGKSQEIFNRLTNNGAIQGIYMLNGQLYINFNYARGGTLTLGGLNNVNGDLKVINADGEETCVMNKDEVRITGDMAIKSKSTQFSNRVFAKFGNTTMPDGGGNVRKYDGFEIYNEKYPDDKLSIMPAGKVSSSGGTSFHATPIIYADTSMNIKGGRASLELEGSAKLAGIVNDEFSTFTLRGNEFSIGVGNTSGSYTLMRSSYGNGVGFDGEILIQGALRATGGKTRVVSTDNYGTVSLNAVESPECYFSEFGGGEIGEEGKCYVFFEPIFLETVNLLWGYRVQVTPTSQGWIEYIEKKLDYFIVYGSIGTTFDFAIYAKQKGFESDRLEQISLPKEKPSENETVLLDDNTDNDANAYLENYEKEILSYD